LNNSQSSNQSLEGRLARQAQFSEAGLRQSQVNSQANVARQEQQIEARLDREVTRTKAREARLAENEASRQDESANQLQVNRSLAAEERARAIQAAAEFDRSNQQRQDEIDQARRSEEAVPRGSIVDILG